MVLGNRPRGITAITPGKGGQSCRRFPGRSCPLRTTPARSRGRRFRGPQPAGRRPGRGDSRRSDSRPPRRRVRDRLPGDRLLLAGNNDGPYHGTEYAVYDFLRSLGVRWFMPGEFGEVVPRQKTIRVPEQQIRQKPDFAMRNWWLHAQPELARQEARWKLRNKEPWVKACPR